jgi:hypothetical protein
MKRYIKSFKLFERTEGVEGLDQFINELKSKFPNHLELLDDLKAFIMQSGCPAIEFDELHGAQGISKTDKCVVNKSVLNSNLENALYIVLHEVSHQYQYTKYGKDVMWDAYSSNIDIDQAVDLLMNIELVADRLAVLKAIHLLKSNGVTDHKPITPVYPAVSRNYFKMHITGLRNIVKEKGIDSIEGANEFMYNKLKEKPKAFTRMPTQVRTSRKSEIEIKIDKILDKMSAGGWSSLSDDEKRFLRAQSK